MYTLTLSHDERRAIDFVGHRYTNGDDLFKALWCYCDISPANVDWDYKGDITFSIPEHVAWKIKSLATIEQHQWPLFSLDLRVKMQRLVDSIM